MFRPWRKIPRLENEVYHITEKIDGTNGCIIITEEGVFAQSRTSLITPEDDNYGFARWVKDYQATLYHDLGPGYHFGEWWGQGINRNYGLTEKRFSLFNPTKQSSICHNVPLLQSTVYLDECVWNVTQRIKKEGSMAAPGFMKPEGLVVYAEKAKTYWKVIIDK